MKLLLIALLFLLACENSSNPTKSDFMGFSGALSSNGGRLNGLAAVREEPWPQALQLSLNGITQPARRVTEGMMTLFPAFVYPIGNTGIASWEGGAVGTEMTFTIISGQDSATGSISLPAVPVLQTPLNGDSLARGQTFIVKWSGDADYFWIRVPYHSWSPYASMDLADSLPGNGFITCDSLLVPGRLIPDRGEIAISIVAVNGPLPGSGATNMICTRGQGVLYATGEDSVITLVHVR